MEKIKFLKQSSVVLLLSLSLLVGCKIGNENPQETVPPLPTATVSPASPNPPVKKKPEQYSQLTREEYDRLKEQTKEDWTNFKTAFENFQKQYQEVIDLQLKKAIPEAKDPPSSNPSPPTLPVGETIELETTLKPVRIAYKNLINSKPVLTKDVTDQLLKIGGDPTTEGKPEDAQNQTPLKHIERVLWPLKSGLELTEDQAVITDPTKKQELENKRKEEIRKVQKIVEASPVDGLYGQGSYDKMKLYLEKQFIAIKGENDTNINGLETAIITNDTAFLLPPQEEPSTFPWWLLLILVVPTVLSIVVYLNLKNRHPSQGKQGGTSGSGEATTETQASPQKPRQKSPSKRQLSDDDYAVLFAAMDHAFKQRKIEIDNPTSFSEEEILKIVKDDLPSPKGTNALGSQIVTRVLKSGRFQQEIRKIIWDDLQQVGYVQGGGGHQQQGSYGGTNQPREIGIQQDQHSHNVQTHQHSGTFPQSGTSGIVPLSSSPSLPKLVEEWRNFYNKRENQEGGQVANEFKKLKAELEETNESNSRRSHRFSDSQDIELEIVKQNNGSFWVIIPEENSNSGWLFPKLKITQPIHKAVQTLFEVEGDLSNHNYIEVIEPAEMMSSDSQIWKLKTKGKIRLY